VSVVELVPYSDAWPAEFEALRDDLAGALGDLAVRIDHIGSTSVPGMSAKDVIDIQITVASLDDVDDVAERAAALGFVRRPYHIDHFPPGWQGDEREWGKIVLAPPEDMRRCNVHVREAGRANQRYALLFRDYMRAHRHAVETWIVMKQVLAGLYPDDLSTYGLVKDAATDVLMLAAEDWAVREDWTAVT
jgi:GrpB-like predicted nucleotidyltransferase (UPF0157 family)